MLGFGFMIKVFLFAYFSVFAFFSLNSKMENVA